jgi:hypothetical protein
MKEKYNNNKLEQEEERSGRIEWKEEEEKVLKLRCNCRRRR